MRTDELDYHLPPRLIAQQGLEDRQASRLLVLHRATGRREHRRFSDLPDYLRPGDCLVLNDSRVIPARFWLRRATGGRIEGLFLHHDQAGRWCVLLKGARRLNTGERIRLEPPPRESNDPATPADPSPTPGPTLLAEARLERGVWLLSLESDQDYLAVLEGYGVTPLPPYIHRDQGERPADRHRYQNVYASAPGSVAAPTAGLHFTDELLARIDAAGVATARVTLHVGLGTFQPVTAERLEDHPMHEEAYELEPEAADTINTTLNHGGRVVAVGTTSVRVLETLAAQGRVRPGRGWTNLMILPGYRFQVVGAMITNFHLPRTTLLALVAAFASPEQVLAAYREAVRLEYRFYSYGDAMLLL